VDLNEYAAKDKKYTIAAIPITTRRFGPSGSLKNKKITLEHTMDVMPRISRGVFFDLKCIFILYQTYKLPVWDNVGTVISGKTGQGCKLMLKHL
jgi:hypothetical protein